MQIAKLLFFTLILSITAFAQDSQRLKLPKELQGDIVPNFFVLAKDNTEELYRDDIKEAVKKTGAKRVVLSFFATYCVSCKEEFAILNKNRAELDKQGVLVYFIDIGESIHDFGDRITEMVSKYAGNFPYYFDPNAILPKNFGLVKPGENLNLPMTLILDSNLRVLSILIGKMGSDFPKVLWSEI